MTNKKAIASRYTYEDIVKQIRSIDEEKVQAIITRPPIIQRIFSAYGDLNYDNLLHNLDELSAVWQECWRVLKNDGTMWIFIDNYFWRGELYPVPLLLAKSIQKLGFLLRNIIIWYNTEAPQLSGALLNRYTCILFFSKSRDYKFNKDSIREPHIWKDVEWGGGRRSRYNPKGKDPSNFWLMAESKMGKIIRHIILSLKDAITRCILVSSDEGDTILDIFAENAPITTIARELGRYSISCYSQLSYNRKIPVIHTKEWIEEKLSYAKKLIRAIYFKSSENMEETPDSSVQVIITSPPYWRLRDYGVPGQIGYNEPYDEYIKRLQKVWRECYRVLTPTGSLWININKRIIKGQMLLFPIDIIKSVTEVGFYLKDIIIWHKPIFVPTTGPKNLTDRHEYILFFTKSKMGYLFKPYMLPESDYIYPGAKGPENVWKMFRKIGNIGKKIEVVINNKKIQHTAVYPHELVKRIILLCTEKGDIVLDPFAGSGTTLVVANALGRSWIGYEINREYEPLIRWRLKNEGTTLLQWM